MKYRKEKSACGPYTSAEGARFNLLCVRRIRTQDGVNVGWTEFPSLAACLSAWGLVYDPLPAPQEEEAAADVDAAEAALAATPTPA